MLQETTSSADPAADVYGEDDWAERSEFWLNQAGSAKPKRRLRQREAAPLILNGQGVSLRVEGGALIIRDGFTHYPQDQAKYRLFPGDLALPPRIILIDGSGTLSFDVLSWLAEQDIPLARVKWTGEVATVAGGGWRVLRSQQGGLAAGDARRWG